MHSRLCRNRRPPSLLAYLLVWSLTISALALSPWSGTVGPWDAQAQGGESSSTSNSTPPQALDYGNWPAIHGDAGHSGAVGFDTPEQTSLPPARLAWQAQIATDPVVSNGLVVGSTFINQPVGLTAVSLLTGKEVWTAKLDEYIWSAPTFDGQGRLFVESIDPSSTQSSPFEATLRALDTVSGQTIWESPLNTVGGTPVVVGSTLLVHTPTSLEALAISNGDPLWSVNLGYVPQGLTPAASGELAVVRDGQMVRALHLANGTEAWNHTMADPMVTTELYLTVGAGLVLVRTEGSENLTALELANGERRWKVGVPGGAFLGRHPAVAPGAVYSTHIDGQGNASLLAMDIDDGQLLWRAPLAAANLAEAAPVATPMGILILGADGIVRVHDPLSGSITSEYDTGVPGVQATYSLSNLALASDRLLVTTPEGLLAFGTPFAPVTPQPSPSGDTQDEGDAISRITQRIADEGLLVMALLAGFFLGLIMSMMRSEKKVDRLKNRVLDLQERLRNYIHRSPEEEVISDAEEESHPDDPLDGEPYAPGEPLPDHVTRAVIVCGAGPLTPAEQEALPEAFIIAADGGANSLFRLGRKPHLLVGDFDSIHPEVLNWCRGAGVPEEQHPPDKDATDGELAIEAALKMGASEILLVGALGGRADHSYANMGLLELIGDKGAFGTIVGPDIDIFAVTPDLPLLQPTAAGRTVSLMPLSEKVVGIHSRGLKWPLVGTAMNRTRTLGVSNETTEDLLEVRVEAGTLLVGINRPAGATVS